MTRDSLPCPSSWPDWARQTLDRLLTGNLTPLDQYWITPELVFGKMKPDPWQRNLLRSTSSRRLLLATRQGGKSQAASALVLWTAITQPESLILLLSPTQRQSGELFRDKVLRLYNAIGRPIPATQESALTLTLGNGSRVISLPGEEGTIRGYSGVNLLVIDEAARVSDSLYRSVRPMLAVSKGRLIAMTTPWGKRGWFYEEWISQNPWERIQVKATDCPRISPEFLAEERQSLGDRWFNQEYMLSFEDVIDAVFSQTDIDAALGGDARPLWSSF